VRSRRHLILNWREYVKRIVLNNLIVCYTYINIVDEMIDKSMSTCGMMSARMYGTLTMMEFLEKLSS
jgi:hypothetical protein